MATGWAKATGASFKFSLKMPKKITHDRSLTGVEGETESFFQNIEPIKRAGKLGCVLIQFPAAFTVKSKAKLEKYLELLPDGIHFAVEFRHESWLTQETKDLLSRYNIAQVITDSPMESFSSPVVTASTHAYVRWHGRGEKIWYDYSYSEDELLAWKEKIDLIENRVSNVYAYFNNHYRANAPSDLVKLLSMRGELSEAQQKVNRRLTRFETKLATSLTDYM